MGVLRKVFSRFHLLGHSYASLPHTAGQATTLGLHQPYVLRAVFWWQRRQRAVTLTGEVKVRIALRPRRIAISFLMRRHWKLTLFSVALAVATIGWLWLLLKAAQHFLVR